MKSQIAAKVEFVRLPRESLERRVTELLRDLIVNGELPEGTPLVQRDLAHRIGVSQTPVRSGLSELARDGLVEVTDTGRTHVSRLTREDLEEIYAARFGLEGLAARVGAPVLTDDGYERMRKLMSGLENLARKRDVQLYLRARWDLHAICYQASGRTRLVAEVERLFWRAERYNRIVLSGGERFRRSVQHYHDVLDACESGSGPRAERVIHRSVRWAVDLVLDTLPPEAKL
jgi:DNA-binding GntR family transcriptional regulator